jgi:predicted DsbA family dithiol-disulfide isomerase
MTVLFYFDPACPWTWLTSRWLAREAEREGAQVTWRSFSLAYANRDRPYPEEYWEAVEAAQAAHRIFEASRPEDESISTERGGHPIPGG